MKKRVTLINCPNCIGVQNGEFLGIVKTNAIKVYMHKCKGCSKQIRIDFKEGLSYA